MKKIDFLEFMPKNAEENLSCGPSHKCGGGR
jgi:hypothetical protein